MPIHILPPEVASQIAAGEVIERPASVVKELLENALDAGANHISIKVEGAGQRMIEVSDNGCGIPMEELHLSVERHATSKLSSASDLFHIRSLGFRGEALASIGSVSRLSITSRTAAADIGARLSVMGGRVLPAEPVGAPAGTLVRVEDLFYNVPARLKFLKKEVTERRLIDNLVTRYALAYPHVRFHLYQEGRAALQTSGKGDAREVLAALYGADTARQMLEVLSKDKDLAIQGFISPLSITRANRREISFFVNGRPVQEAALVAALVKSYHTMLMVGRYPVAFLLLDLPPELVDVNVHPTKAEVRFSQPDAIFTGVQNAARRALLAHNPLPGIEREPGWSGGALWHQVGIPPRNLDWEMVAGSNLEQADNQPATEYPSQPGITSQRIPLLRPIGQVANAYLIAEAPDGLYLIDQHAAHERVLFERYLAQAEDRIPMQTLLQPAAVDLPKDQVRLLTEQLPMLAKLGFQVESFGPASFLVRAIPSLLAASDASSALRVLVDDFEEDETPLQAQIEARIIARVCKRAAIKSGQTLSPEEQRGLILDLEACQSPRTCPHGRPTMIHLSIDLLERQFGRKGAR